MFSHYIKSNIVTWLSAGLGIRSSNFGTNRSFFAKKVSKWAINSKSEQFDHLLIFGERPERFTHDSLFLLRDISDSLTSLRRTKRPEQFAHFAQEEWAFAFFLNFQENFKKVKNTIFSNFFERIAHFLWAKEKMSDLLKKLSTSLIRSFVLSNLSKLLAFAHL